MATTSINLSPDVIQRLRKIASEHKLNVGWLIARAVEQFLMDYDETGQIILAKEMKRGRKTDR